MGSPDFALPTLRALIAGEYTPVVVVTQPDRPAGRGRVLRPPPVKPLAEAAGIPVLQPERLRDPDALAALAAYAPQFQVICAYGQILSRDVLALPSHGTLNVHASLLPALARRGARGGGHPRRRPRVRRDDHARRRGPGHRPDLGPAGRADSRGGRYWAPQPAPRRSGGGLAHGHHPRLARGQDRPAAAGSHPRDERAALEEGRRPHRLVAIGGRDLAAGAGPPLPGPARRPPSAARRCASGAPGRRERAAGRPARSSPSGTASRCRPGPASSTSWRSSARAAAPCRRRRSPAATEI